MKLINVILVGLMLGACTREPRQVLRTPPAIGHEATIGTRGGGGTVVFTFRQGAIIAHRAMERILEIGSLYGSAESAKRFYFEHRDRILQALEQIAQDEIPVNESAEPLIDFGIEVGAVALPVDKPHGITLSIPYLTGKDGFTHGKAFALAFHEACHLAVPGMTESDHRLVDVISSYLYSMTTKNIGQSSPLFFNLASEWSPLSITSDGRLAVFESTRDNGHVEKILIFDLNTQNSYIQNCPFVPPEGRKPHEIYCALLNGDYLYLYSGSGNVELRNLISQHTHKFTFAEAIFNAQLSRNNSMLVARGDRHQYFVDLSNGEIVPREYTSVIRGNPLSLQRVLSADGSLEAVSAPSHIFGTMDRMVVQDVQSGEIIDYVKPDLEQIDIRPVGIFQNNSSYAYLLEGVTSSSTLVITRGSESPLSFVDVAHYGFSPDQSKLLILNYVSRPMNPRTLEAVIYDSWRGRVVPFALNLNIYRPHLHWVKDDNSLLVAVTLHDTVHLKDFKTGTDAINLDVGKSTNVRVSSTAAGLAVMSFTGSNIAVQFVNESDTKERE